jgi:hypothetical protein
MRAPSRESLEGPKGTAPVRSQNPIVPPEPETRERSVPYGDQDVVHAEVIAFGGMMTKTAERCGVWIAFWFLRVRMSCRVPNLDPIGMRDAVVTLNQRPAASPH